MIEFRNDGTDYHPLFFPENAADPKPPARLLSIHVHRREAGGEVSAPYPFDPLDLVEEPQLGALYGDGVYILTARAEETAKLPRGHIYAKRIIKLKGYGPSKPMVAADEPPPPPTQSSAPGSMNIPGIGQIPSDPMALLVMIFAQQANEAREERKEQQRQRDEDRRAEAARADAAAAREEARAARQMEMLINVLGRPDPSTALVGQLIPALITQKQGAQQSMKEIKEMVEVAKSLTPPTDGTADIIGALSAAAAAIGPALIQASQAKEERQAAARAEQERQTITVPAEQPAREPVVTPAPAQNIGGPQPRAEDQQAYEAQNVG